MYNSRRSVIISRVCDFIYFTLRFTHLDRLSLSFSILRVIIPSRISDPKRRRSITIGEARDLRKIIARIFSAQNFQRDADRGRRSQQKRKKKDRKIEDKPGSRAIGLSACFLIFDFDHCGRTNNRSRECSVSAVSRQATPCCLSSTQPHADPRSSRRFHAPHTPPSQPLRPSASLAYSQRPRREDNEHNERDRESGGNKRRKSKSEREKEKVR